MLWLGIDFETTGLDPKTDRVTEIGAVLWDVENKKPVRMYNELLWDTENSFHITEEITDITGLDDAICKEHGVEPVEGFTVLTEMMGCAQYAVAHNAPFDKGFYEAETKRHSTGECVVPWIDTLQDVDYRTSGSTSLSYLASDHGFLNPFSHRALFDVLTMFKVISEYPPAQIIAWQNSPNVTLRALVDFKTKDLAKPLGYKYQGPPTKHWLKTIKEFNIDEEMSAAKAAGFDVHTVKG
jgi:DNA polymerase-3 subunit epsilon